MEYLKPNDIVKIKKEILEKNPNTFGYTGRDYIVKDIVGFSVHNSYLISIVSDKIDINIQADSVEKIGHLYPIWKNGKIIGGEIK